MPQKLLYFLLRKGKHELNTILIMVLDMLDANHMKKVALKV
jgi:hypothetical protein